ncbi:MAG: hypothetical protein PHX07_01100 [Candidatus Marinimicrobia bacterium]|jgi:hypothetical protein|nr:hypothetical protein [Candidatus Neomarinimicrobiota bacterium]MDD4960813.1 hypothetical protein [Candidatus Neomarinimicrobiota bacterium]MDD5709818.1 hypothetical protein [Candidatus Neomarinimicrobiota bacterium]
MKTGKKLLIAGLILSALGIATKFLLDRILLKKPDLDFDDELELEDLEEPKSKKDQ